MNSDGTVLRPVLTSNRGLVFAQAMLPMYSAIDAWHMTTCTIDEALRRMLALGADPDHIGGVDNFCWPSIQYDPQKNPDGKFKAAQLVRSCRALAETCLAYGIPLLSGKDSMYVDGHLAGRYGETHKVSALESLQFSTIGVIPDVETAVTMDVKMPGDLVYVLGETRDELGASEYYQCFGYTGANVPKVRHERFMKTYRALHRAIARGLIASAHGIYRGGLGVHLAMIAMGGNHGLSVDIARVFSDDPLRTDHLLFSETPGRFLVSLAPENARAFESLFEPGQFACIGEVTDTAVLNVCRGSNSFISVPVSDLKSAWKMPFGGLI